MTTVTNDHLSRKEQVELMRKNFSEVLGREIDTDKALNLLALVKVMEDLGVKPLPDDFVFVLRH